ncbi:MAG: cadherin-like domain-containing protein, partial [Pirellulaceae bacterium]|nr:cadherin-like domain-containing protein [Pirellulaceae bacterium]
SSHNFIGYVGGVSGITNGVNGNQIGVTTPIDPLLGPLQDNGGPTWTHAPLPGSPLIDAGNDAQALDAKGNTLLTDQRGFVRLYGTVDIGAVESQPPGIPVAHDDGFVIEQDDMVTMDVLLNDFCNDGSPMTAVLLDSPTHGTLDENPDGTWTYTPEPGFWGVDTFSYQAANGELISNTAQVFVSVLSPTSIIVTTADDEYDGDLSPSDISLREALELAIASPGSTIQFSAALLNQVILLTNPAGRLPVANVQVVGLGAPFLTIDGNQRGTVIVTGGESFLSHLTVTGGTNSGIIAYGGSLSLDHVVVRNNSSARGGGIAVEGPSSRIFLDSSTVSGNSATQQGGGIYVNGGTLTVVNSTISGNSAAQYGGGVYSYGSSAMASISNSTISGNTAVSYAGGIFNSGVLTVTASTISHNSATAGSGFGGGIGNTGTATIINSTMSSNSATGTSGRGGGLASSGQASKLTLVNLTITANSAGGQGGGVYVSNTPNPTVLHNTVVAGNNGAGQSQFYGTVSSVSSHN